MSDVNETASLSDRDMLDEETVQTPPNFVTQRGNKRSRESPGTDLQNFKEEMRTMIQHLMLSQENELKIITPTLLALKQQCTNIENSIVFLTEQNEELKKKVEKIEIERKQDHEYINFLEDKVEDMLRDSRKKNIEIKNAPKKEKETQGDLVTMVIELSKTTGHDITPSDISDIYRVRSRQSDIQNTPIIVEMVSAIRKSELLQKCKQHNINNKENKLCAKHLGYTTLETPIYVSEHLTPKAARLRFLARDLARSKQYEFCWTAIGRVFIRKNKTSAIINITSESQIQRLFQET